MSCAVCMEPIVTGDDPYSSPCGHVLHLMCWRECLSRALQCPVCRRATCERILARLYFNDNEEDIFAPYVRRIGSLSTRMDALQEGKKAAEDRITKELNTNAQLREQVREFKSKLVIATKRSVNYLKDCVDYKTKEANTMRSLQTVTQQLKESEDKLAIAVEKEANTMRSLQTVTQQLKESKDKLAIAVGKEANTMRSLQTVTQQLKESEDKLAIAVEKEANTMRSLQTVTQQLKESEDKLAIALSLYEDPSKRLTEAAVGAPRKPSVASNSRAEAESLRLKNANVALQKQLETEIAAKTAAQQRLEALFREVEGSNFRKSVLRKEVRTAKQIVEKLLLPTTPRAPTAASEAQGSATGASRSNDDFVSDLRKSLLLLSGALNALMERLRPISVPPETDRPAVPSAPATLPRAPATLPRAPAALPRVPAALPRVPAAVPR